VRYGSLFAGYGGLEMGVSSVLGGEPAWFSEIDKAPSKILAHHWPTVPNLGDITTVDWDAMEPIDVLTGGFPCQDVSHAGKRLGLKPGTRSGLWSHMAYAIDKLRPRLVVAENVRGLLSAEAGGDLEPCPWCVGDAEGSPLRALGAVLGDLADLGYDAQWHGVRASDAGAPHGRFRVFVYAWPTEHANGRGRRTVGLPGVGATVGVRRGDTRDAATPTDPGPHVPADADRVGHERPRGAWGRRGGPTDSGVPAPDASGERHGRGVHPGDMGPVDGDHASEARQRERAREVPRDRSAEAAADTDDRGRADAADHPGGTRSTRGGGTSGEPTPRRTAPRARSSRAVAWGEYEPAIRRWEALTRPAPAPTEPGKNGAARLSPAFVEWMMGLPAGHVTAVPGLTRNDQLKALGNGVVPQQAALATRAFLASQTQESAA
jgi:DNA (cytosine-5)-methyltransferase 1